MRDRRPPLVSAALLAAANAAAQSQPEVFDPIVVSASREASRAFDVPASVDVIDARAIHEGQPQVNLSESLVRVPGVFAANRQNYAQDLQVSSRGFGARATFGVRGVRLYQDGIPATMPDGQGQTGSFSLLSAERIEVLRGPFSTLYGNSSGGVIAVFTEDPRGAPLATLDAGAGSYGAWTLGAKLNSGGDGQGVVAAASRFHTDGYRDHSAADRDLANLKLVALPDAATRIAFVAGTQSQHETQDPLGLTRAQWEADPRSVDPAATFFDTRKTVRQGQAGIELERRLSDAWTLDAHGYYGERAIRQYLALSGAAETSSGGVTDLDRDYGGVGAHLTWRGGRGVRVIVGADTDRQHERRRGYVNDNGNLGELRRDEDDVVTSADGYAEIEATPWARWTFTGGVRTSTVKYTSDDHYITAHNPDDSGARRFRDTSPILGAVWHVAENVNAYAAYGHGFETPTFAEMAYRNGGTGLNFDLRPATSRAAEVGVKALLAPRQRATFAAFLVKTDDEIAVDTATGGRTVFRNAGSTRRRGVEGAWAAQFERGFSATVAATWLSAEFDSGAKLPGVPSKQAFGEIAWRPAALGGASAALEAQYVDKLYVNDRNSDAAPSYAVANARVGYDHAWNAVRASAYVRVNNLFDRNYAGSVIVGDTNGRYFEPAPGRNWFAGIEVAVTLR